MINQTARDHRTPRGPMAPVLAGTSINTSPSVDQGWVLPCARFARSGCADSRVADHHNGAGGVVDAMLADRPEHNLRLWCGSANYQDGPVGEVYHLVCGAAEHQGGQVAAPS